MKTYPWWWADGLSVIFHLRSRPESKLFMCGAKVDPLSWECAAAPRHRICEWCVLAFRIWNTHRVVG